MIHKAVFETLPLHPQPEDFESFTSYLSRLAYLNGMRRVKALNRLLEIPLVRQRYVQDLAPNNDFGKLPTLAACPENRLYYTTCLPLVSHFSHFPATPKSCSSFLAHSLSPVQRFCPDCLRQKQYYKLTWSFLALSGCAIHHTTLLDCCSHCGSQIPMLSLFPHFGTCPTCHRELGSCVTQALPASEVPEVGDLEHMLNTLLDPRTDPPTDFRTALGSQILAVRLQKQLSLPDVSKTIDISQKVLASIEHQVPVDKQRGSFTVYLTYAKYLGYSLPELVSKTREQGRHPDIPKAKYLTIYKTWWETRIRPKVEGIIATMEQNGETVNLHNVAAKLDGDMYFLRWWTSIRSLLPVEALVSKRYVNTSFTSLEVQHAIQQLQAEGISVTYQNLADLLDTTVPSLHLNKAVKRQMRAYFKYQRDIVRPQERVEQVKKAIQELEEGGEPITQVAISRLVGNSKGNWLIHPEIRELLLPLTGASDTALEKERQEEAHWLRQVQQAITALQVQNHPVTQLSISRHLNTSIGRLKRFPAVRQMMHALVEAGWKSDELPCEEITFFAFTLE